MEQNTLTLLDEPPNWFVAFFDEIDNKGFGSPFDNVFLDESEMQFGVSHWKSRAEIKANLQKFDDKMDTHHVVKEFWDSALLKVVRGEITFTRHDDGKTATSQIVHILHMAKADPSKIAVYYGAAGPGI